MAMSSLTTLLLTPLNANAAPLQASHSSPAASARTLPPSPGASSPFDGRTLNLLLPRLFASSPFPRLLRLRSLSLIPRSRFRFDQTRCRSLTIAFYAFTGLLLLNMLIAMMAKTFDQVRNVTYVPPSICLLSLYLPSISSSTFHWPKPSIAFDQVSDASAVNFQLLLTQARSFDALPRPSIAFHCLPLPFIASNLPQSPPISLLR